MIQYDNSIDSSCSPLPAFQPWQVSDQMKPHRQEKVGILLQKAI